MFGRTLTAETEWVPENLDAIPPGYVLAAVLDDIDINQCSGYDRIRVLQAHQRMQAHYAALSYHAMTAVVDACKDDDGGFADEAAAAGAAEIAAALRLTRRAADAEMTLALELQRRLPGVWDALCEGTIDVRRARVIVNNTLHLTIAGARSIVDEVIGDAPLLTTGQLQAKLRKLCIEVDPDDAKDRYQRAVEDRRVIFEPTVDGTSELHALSLSPERAAAARANINQLALHAKRNGDTRTMDQLRTDILLDLLSGTQASHTCKGGVELLTDLPTLTGLADNPGELAGYGPVIADIARQVVKNQQNTEWRWTLVDPDTGMPIDGGITRRRPTTAQRRRVQTRHRTCVHPGCRMPATACDIDHRIPWSESHITKTDDLAPLCRHHHTIRHRHGWTYRPLPSGDFEFTTPLGHTYTTSGRSP